MINPRTEHPPREPGLPAASGVDWKVLPEGEGADSPRVQLSIDLPVGTSMKVRVETFDADGASTGSQTITLSGAVYAEGTASEPAAPLPMPVTRTAIQEAPPLPWRVRRAAWLPRLAGWVGRRVATAVKTPLDQTLLWGAMAVYLITRLVGLESYPIYFFTDEAIQTNLAADFLARNFLSREGEFFPTFFVNGGQYNLSISVYLQMLPYLFFGKSVWVTRAVPALVSAGGVLAVALFLQEFLMGTSQTGRRGWIGVLLLAITPAWFLHSRTAFETSLMVSFYAGCLYTYLLYRCRSPRYLYAAIGLGALVLYSYSAGPAVMAVTGLLLLVLDGRYHWVNRHTFLRGLGLAALLALPYGRFLVEHPEENLRHLQVLNSYWTEALPLGEKLHRYASEYLTGLSPSYWYFPNPRDLARHVMDGFGHILRPTLPFALLGLGIALRRIASPAHRMVLVALLAAPAGAALVQVGITRSLVFVIPAALLTALGISALVDWLARRRLPDWLPGLVLFAALAGTSLWMLGGALRLGPLWSRDYGMGGMQYGARQVFPAAQAYLQAHPDTRILLSPSWANGTDEVARFFLPDPLPVQLGTIEGHMMQRLPLDDRMLFVMIPEEYRQAAASGKFKDLRVEQTLPYPDGSPGFYFVRLRYADDFDAQIAAEREKRRQPQSASLLVDGLPVQVKYSTLDIGTIHEAFDRDRTTLIRSLEANPLRMDLSFATPRTLEGVTVRVGGTAARVTATVTGAEEAGLPTGEATFVEEVGEDSWPRDLSIRFHAPLEASSLRLEVSNVLDGEVAHVHVWEVWLRP